MRRFVEGVDRKLAFRAWVQRGQSRIVLFSVGLLCCSFGPTRSLSDFLIWLGGRRTARPAEPMFDRPLTAASALFALKAGVWFRRGLIVSSDSLGTACPLPSRNSTYSPIQILEVGSILSPPSIHNLRQDVIGGIWRPFEARLLRPLGGATGHLFLAPGSRRSTDQLLEGATESCLRVVANLGRTRATLSMRLINRPVATCMRHCAR